MEKSEKERKQLFEEIRLIKDGHAIHMREDLNSHINLQSAMEDYNKEMVTAGFEGIMIKDPNGKWEGKRSTAWLKQKPFIEVSLEITAVEEGTGRNVGRLGAIICQGVDDGKTIQVNVGSGFTDKDRGEYWEARDSLPGQVVEVRADAVTQNQDGSYSLRFPRFLRFRGFEIGEKL